MNEFTFKEEPATFYEDSVAATEPKSTRVRHRGNKAPMLHKLFKELCRMSMYRIKASRHSLADRLGVTVEEVIWLLRSSKISLLAQQSGIDASLAAEVERLLQKHPDWSTHRLARETGTYSSRVKRVIDRSSFEDYEARLSMTVSSLKEKNKQWSTSRIAATAGTHRAAVRQILIRQTKEEVENIVSVVRD